MSNAKKSRHVGAPTRLPLAIAAVLSAAAAVAGEPMPFAALGDMHPHLGKSGGAAKSVQARAPNKSALTAASVSVTSCDDDFSAGTLRQVVNVADPGGIVDLSGLSCNSITLQHGAIEVAYPDLTFVGPGSGKLTIDGAGSDRVLHHTGKGTLSVQSLRVSNGKVTGDDAYGGCIYSAGSVLLEDAVVASCKAVAQSLAAGGGVVALGSLTAIGSTISDNVAQSLQGPADGGIAAGGGGAYSGGGMGLVRSVVSGNKTIAVKGFAFGGGLVGPEFMAKYSTISGNDASSAGTIDDPGIGGGLATNAKAQFFACTIDGNSADIGGAVFSNDDYYKDVMRFSQTTISGNIGRIGAAALDVVPAVSFENSTVAFNVSDAQLPYALFLQGAVTAKSSIFANNTPADVYATVIDGDHDLIKLAEASTVLPMDTKTSDPKLQPLAWNGGLTRTHALGAGSPAINGGSNPFSWQRDQRGPTYRRVVGAAADIGAVETDTDHIFGSALEFPSG